MGIPPLYKGSVTHPMFTAFTHPNAGIFGGIHAGAPEDMSRKT